MKVFEKLKNLISIKHASGAAGFGVAKTVGVIAVAVGNLAAIAVGTLAWFNLSVRDSSIEIVSGDINVEVRKVTAYKYIYPYYKNSTEFIDYDSAGTVKKYVLEDHTLTYDAQNVKSIPITSDDATITLGARYDCSSNVTTDPIEADSNHVLIPEVELPEVYKPEFRYYLIGDNVFSGVNSNWAVADGYAFAMTEDVTAQKSAVLDNIVVSEGSSFRLLEVLDAGTHSTYHFLPLNGITEEESPFRLFDDDEDEKNDRLLCLRSGIYKFTYSPNQLRIELHTKDAGARKDISVISNNSLDPTKVSIDYSGSVNKTDSEAENYFPTIESYMPTAIYNQNTTMVIDAELNFKNANIINASLKIERTDSTSNSIINLDSKYADTTHNLDGYVNESNTNPLRASDFYNYYAVFTKTPYANANAIWAAMHRIGDVNSQKFVNGNTYDKTIECPLNLKDNETDSILIPAVDPNSQEDHIYHCYIAIDYDYEHNVYFLDKNRLGKTYILDRDFGFYFYGEQVVAEQN